jgi:hypothetical protein
METQDMRPSTVNHIVKVGNVILTERGKPSRRPIRLSFSQRTLNAVRKFIYWRHDGPCVTDDWVWYIDAVLPLLVQVSKEKGHPPGWVRQMADEIFPRMDCCPEWWDEQIEEASKPVGIKVDTIAKRLGIKEIELDRALGQIGGSVAVSSRWTARRGLEPRSARKKRFYNDSPGEAASPID